MSELSAHIFVIDDDTAIRESLRSLLRSVGYEVSTFASTQEFLESEVSGTSLSSCLILDVRLRGLSGLDFQQQLRAAGRTLPIIFITGFGDIAMSVQAMKAGAVDFLPKPFRDQDLLDAVAQALLKQPSVVTVEDDSLQQTQERFATLTAREQEVMAYVVDGLMNKQIAAELGLSEITIKIHRGNAMRKMQAQSFAELVKMGQLLNVTAQRRRYSAS